MTVSNMGSLPLSHLPNFQCQALDLFGQIVNRRSQFSHSSGLRKRVRLLLFLVVLESPGAVSLDV